MIKQIYLVFFLLLFACKEKKPYQAFETKLNDQVCSCMSLQKINNEDTFLKKYETCQLKISELLEHGIDQYPEDSRISKEKFKEKLPALLQDLVKNNKCSDGF